MISAQTLGSGNGFLDYLNAKRFLDCDHEDHVSSFGLATYSFEGIAERIQSQAKSCSIILIASESVLFVQLTPVAYADATGHMAITTVMLLIGIGVGAAIGAATNVVSQYVSNGGWDNFNWASLGWNTLIGAVSGALAMSSFGVSAIAIANAGLSAVGSVGNHLIAGDSFSSPKTWADIGLSAGIGFLTGLAGGPGALHGEGLPSAASEFVRSANSYLRVICKASNGGYATSRGANIALGITRNNFIRALNALHSSMATGGKFLAASVFVSISGAFTEGLIAYGW